MNELYRDEKTALLTRLLAELPGLEATSKAAVVESISRFLEEAVETLAIDGAAVLLHDESRVETLASAGIPGDILAGIVDCIENMKPEVPVRVRERRPTPGRTLR